MKTYQVIFGIVVLSFVVFCSPAFGDQQGMGYAEAKYTSIIDNVIAKYQAKIDLKDSESAELKQEALEASKMSVFLKDYKKELIAEMIRKDVGFKDHQISNFLNEQYMDRYNSAWLQYCCNVKDPE